MLKEPEESKRRRGRPRRSSSEREAAQERRIPVSRKGRLKFRPGSPHALDVQMREARNYQRLIAAKLEQFQAILSVLTTDDLSGAVGEQEATLKAYIMTTYMNHKHREHILATFLAIRRARLLAKLDAALGAMEMVADLLHPDDTLVEELRVAVEHQRQVVARTRQMLEPDLTEQTTALIHVTGPDEPSVQMQLDAIRAERERQETDDPTRRIQARHIYGDVSDARERVAAFEAQMAVIRAAISPAIGWYEEYYIEKVRLNRQVLPYLKRGEELPPGVEVVEGVVYGPYLKYRWQEATGGPQYTIQMGLVPEEERGSQSSLKGDGHDS